MDGRHFDLSSDAYERSRAGASGGRRGGVPQPFLGVMFACCNVYSRVYRTADGTAYRGGCPRCGRLAQFRVGSGGSSSRFFRAE